MSKTSSSSIMSLVAAAAPHLTDSSAITSSNDDGTPIISPHPDSHDDIEPREIRRTRSTSRRSLHHRSHSKLDLDPECPPASSTDIRHRRRRSSSRNSSGGGGGHHRRSESSTSSGIDLKLKPSQTTNDLGSPLNLGSPSSIKPLTGENIMITIPSDLSSSISEQKKVSGENSVASLSETQYTLEGTCHCKCVCPEILVMCKKCKKPYSKTPLFADNSGNNGNSGSGGNELLTSLHKSTSGVNDESKATLNKERFIDSCKARIAGMYETLGRISSVVYEIMQNFDFENPENQPPVGVDTNSYLKRLTTNYMFAIKNIQAIAVNALVDTMKHEDENLKAESLHMLSIRKAAEKRDHHVQELIDTEKNFNEGLRLIQEVWKPEMASAGLLDKYADDVLFKTIPLVKRVSDDFLKSFEAVKKMPSKRQNIGKIMCDDFDRFNAFKQNCLTQQDASNLIKKLSSKQSFKTFEAHVKENPQVKNLNFAEYIFSPAQRVTRYPLLIKDIVKVTDQRHPDYKSLVELCDKFGELNKEINDANALQTSVEQFVALKMKLKWTHDPYDFIANKAILHFTGKTSWKMFGEDSKKPLSKGTYVVFTNKCILACAEKIRDIRELETMPIKEWKIVEDSEKPNDFILRSTDPNDTRRFVIESSDYVSFMNYKRTFETCVSDSDRTFKVTSMFKAPTNLSKKLFIPQPSIPNDIRRAQDEKCCKLPSSDCNASDDVIHPKYSRSIRNPPKVGPSEVFLINSDINGFFGQPVFKESDISDDIHKICTSQPMTFRVLSNTPILDLPELKRGQSARINQTRHRHKLSVNLTSPLSEGPHEEATATQTSPRRSDIFPGNVVVKKPFPSTSDEPDEPDESAATKPKTAKNGLFKKLAPKAANSTDSDDDSD